MTLYTTDYLEFYLTLVGWIINNGIWNVLISSGVFAIPFIAMIVQEWLKARGEGSDEGNKGALSAARIENRVWMAVLVIFFAGVPSIDVDLNTIKYDDNRSKQCQVKVPTPENTGWGQSFTMLNGQSAKVPVWWFFVHSVSRAITGSAVASIPCGLDLRQMRMDLDAMNINDPMLQQEVMDFTRDCYGPARAKLFMTRPALDESGIYDVSWVGSTLLVNGYYDGFRSSTPREFWSYNETRDAGLPNVNGGGYPTCRQWWSDTPNGLRERLLDKVDPSMMQMFTAWANSIPQGDVYDQILRVLISPSKQVVNRGEVYTDYGGQIDMTIWNSAGRAGSMVGSAVGSVFFFPMMDVVRQALPIALSFLKMALTICIPLIIVIGTYELKTVITISCVQFALFFLDFWFQLARWLDSTILEALYGWNSPHSNPNIWIGLNNGFADIIMMLVSSMMFLVLPAFWITTLAYAGVRAGAIAQQVAQGTDGAKNATNTGINKITK